MRMPVMRPMMAPMVMEGTKSPAGTLIPNVNTVNTNFRASARLKERPSVNQGGAGRRRGPEEPNGVDESGCGGALIEAVLRGGLDRPVVGAQVKEILPHPTSQTGTDS